MKSRPASREPRWPSWHPAGFEALGEPGVQFEEGGTGRAADGDARICEVPLDLGVERGGFWSAFMGLPPARCGHSGVRARLRSHCQSAFAIPRNSGNGPATTRKVKK